MHLLQVCNVGDICGGTAACAWSVIRALPHMQHSVVFLSRVTAATRTAFEGVQVYPSNRVTERLLRDSDPDVCLLHNTSADRFVAQTSMPLIQYQHSVGHRQPADVHAACSNWLKDQIPGSPAVLYQGVPEPPRPQTRHVRELRDRLVVGRICTPAARKWPAELIPFYEHLARQHPQIDWEFVGCPQELESPLRTACQGRARFHEAGWSARSLLWTWDVLLYHHPLLTESFGRTVAEAMRAGCVPVVDARGGFAEQVSPETGVLCKTPTEFDSALTGLTERENWLGKSRAAREVATSRFSLATFSLQLRRMFEQAACA